MTTRNVVLLSALVGFISGLGGANVQPVLTGAGKLLFPENATPATISASSGALTLAAGGSNQNVAITPSGSGLTDLTVGDLRLANNVSLRFFDSGGTARTVLFQDNTNPDIVSLRNNQHGVGGPITINPKSGAAESARFFASGGASLGSTTDPGAGVFNAANGFSKGGAAGLTGTATSTHGAGSCILTISGGIITATSGC